MSVACCIVRGASCRRFTRTRWASGELLRIRFMLRVLLLRINIAILAIKSVLEAL